MISFSTHKRKFISQEDEIIESGIDRTPRNSSGGKRTRSLIIDIISQKKREIGTTVIRIREGREPLVVSGEPGSHSKARLEF